MPCTPTLVHMASYGNLSETSGSQGTGGELATSAPHSKHQVLLAAENCSGDSCQTIRQSILKAGVLSVIQVPGIITFRCGILEASREYVDRKLEKVLRYRHSDSDAITKNMFINLNCAQLYFRT